jgi:2-polyprenyl-3-methyl-5-hydroxy-6-metoxy-1,4-benzoquinol methylase
MDPERQILQTWTQNAQPWISAISHNQIESRLLVTNAAIVNAVCSLQPTNTWDVGCGEGWLCRALQQKGIACTGTDAIAALVEKAKAAGEGKFEQAAYQQIITGEYQPPEKYEVVVFNFSLFGNELLAGLLRKMREHLNKDGHLVIQTLHPLAALADEKYQDGWRQGSWQGFSSDFVDPAPWYYRTMGSWVSLLLDAGYQLTQMIEPVHPHTGMPASLILIAAIA